MRAGKPKTKERLGTMVRNAVKNELRIYESKERERTIREIKEQVADEFTELVLYQHNVDMLSVLFALRDEFKFGKERLIRTLKKASEHADNMYREQVSVDDMLAILEEETGVTEADLTFKTEVTASNDNG